MGNKNCLDYGKNNKGQIKYRTAQYIFISKYARGKKKIIKILNEQAQLFLLNALRATYNFTTNNPRNKAIQKLMNVPATTYSDFSDSLTEEKRSIDLAAIKKPIASY